MRFVITGAGGFLGSHLAYHLLANTQHDVVAISSQDPSHVLGRVLTADDPALTPETRFSVENNQTLLQSALLRQGDVVVNCAFPWNRGGHEMAKGLEFQRDLFHRANESQVRTLINISSQSVYDQERDYPASESSPLVLDSPYAVGKYATEMLASEVLSNASLVNVRMASLIGRGYDVRIVNRFVKQAWRGEPIKIKRGLQLFDFMDVRDAIRALVLIGETEVLAPTLNVGPERPLTLREIAESVAASISQVTGLETRVELLDERGTPHNSSLDCQRLTRLYGFHTQKRLSDTVTWILQDVLKDGA